VRIAALYDIHANLPALEAVLAEVEAAAPDLVVIGGDVAAGPLPGETLDRGSRESTATASPPSSRSWRSTASSSATAHRAATPRSSPR
jgi:3',5'-cyclic AMP phosphodiesterase CpdA